ncbi:MAG: uracil-DNA glycosylase [Treponema sp.]|jgi:DNA polymerase|nr:uracil-DNA glycosylase [Treponema sp.]
MTIEQKAHIAEFLDLASAYLRSGYKRQSTDDKSAAPVAVEPAAPQAPLPESQLEAIAPPDTHIAGISNDEAGMDTLEAIAADIAACAACPLHATRTNTVPGEGVSSPLVLVIGEGPGENEDKSGRPFVGEAGQLLDKMLASINLSRGENSFIANVVKCRPPHNRDPLPEEIAACAPFLTRQIALLKPRVILCAGRVATQTLVKTTNSIKNLHGHFIECAQIPFFPMYHPSALLHDPSLKRPSWDDLKTLRVRLEKLAALKV